MITANMMKNTQLSNSIVIKVRTLWKALIKSVTKLCGLVVESLKVLFR